MRKLFQDCNVEAKKLSPNNHCDYDVVFTLNDIFFVFDCKTYSNAYLIKDCEDFYFKLQKYLIKINKHAEYFARNLDFVRRKFSKPNDWQSKK